MDIKTNAAAKMHADVKTMVQVVMVQVVWTGGAAHTAPLARIRRGDAPPPFGC